MSTLEFTVPGKVTSANRVTRRVGNKSLKSASARRDHERIKGLALCAAIGARWKIPERALVTITAHNSRLDCGNIEKVIVDAMKGVAIVDDNPKHLGGLVVGHGAKDKLGERYVVRVAAIEGRAG